MLCLYPASCQTQTVPETETAQGYDRGFSIIIMYYCWGFFFLMTTVDSKQAHREPCDTYKTLIIVYMYI